jgi:hypothetical protein
MAKKVVTPESEAILEPGSSEEFDSFFDEALKDEGAPAEVKPIEAKPEEVKVEEAKPEEKEAADKEAADKEAADEEAAEKEAEAKELKEVERIAKVAERVVEKVVGKSAPKVEEVKPAPVKETFKLSSDEEAQMTAYSKDWPDHAKAMEIHEKILLANVEKVLTDALAPLFAKIPELEKSVQGVVGNSAVETLARVHPDWDILVPEVEKWIPSLPKYLQNAANQTLDSGSSADMIELLNDFKEATGRTKVEEGKKEEKKEVINPADNPRIQSMASTKSSRTSVTAAADPNDFDGAFEEFLKTD